MIETYEFDSFHLHITNVDVYGTEGEWAVWLNTEVSNFDGLCIGLAATKEEAVSHARRTLDIALAMLRHRP